MADVEQDGALGEEGFDEGMEDDMIPMEGAESLEEQGSEDVNALKKRLAEMEAEAANMQRSVGEVDKPVDASVSGDGAAPMSEADLAEKQAAEQAAKEEVDSRSIFVGNVDYAVTPEQLQQHFQSCGTVNRVTILVDKAGNPKAYAYIEFLEVDAVANAILLDSTELNGRALKVSQKRTNLPFRKARGRGGGRFGGGGGRGGGFAPYGGYGFGGFAPPPPYGGRGYGGYGYGAPPRGRGGRARGRGRGGRFYQPY